MFFFYFLVNFTYILEKFKRFFKGLQDAFKEKKIKGGKSNEMCVSQCYMSPGRAGDVSVRGASSRRKAALLRRLSGSWSAGRPRAAKRGAAGEPIPPRCLRLPPPARRKELNNKTKKKTRPRRPHGEHNCAESV